MARTNQHGKGIRRVLGWLVNRDLTDAQMASALGIRPSNYARRKDQDDFPSFEELTRLGEHFDINPLVLQISFGFLPPDAIYLLDEAGLDSYRQLGGGDFPDLPLPWNGEEKSRTVPSAVRPQQLQQRL